mmetsp:Transcript_55735/g.129800  ORF Transcript_55735/g.129800 Transcript_55735/m.129800 type:complete len:264 (-) Transcript_55735:264-1055(-)
MVLVNLLLAWAFHLDRRDRLANGHEQRHAEGWAERQQAARPAEEGRDRHIECYRHTLQHSARVRRNLPELGVAKAEDRHQWRPCGKRYLCDGLASTHSSTLASLEHARNAVEDDAHTFLALCEHAPDLRSRCWHVAHHPQKVGDEGELQNHRRGCPAAKPLAPELGPERIRHNTHGCEAMWDGTEDLGLCRCRLQRLGPHPLHGAVLLAIALGVDVLPAADRAQGVQQLAEDVSTAQQQHKAKDTALAKGSIEHRWKQEGRGV